MTGRDRRAIRESIPRLVLGWAGPDSGGLGGGLGAGAGARARSYLLLALARSLTASLQHCTGTSSEEREQGEGEEGVEGGTRALARALGRFRNKHGQAGVSDLDLGGRRAAVIGGLGFGAVVRAWAMLPPLLRCCCCLLLLVLRSSPVLFPENLQRAAPGALAPFTPLLRRSGTGWSRQARSPLPSGIIA